MNKKKIIYTLLVVVWMIVIFFFSAQNSNTSSGTSKGVSQIIIDIIHIQDKYTQEEIEGLIQIVEPIIRKIAHYTIYIAGGVLLINCVFQYMTNENISIVISYIIGTMYAISDEIHQLFVSGRSGQFQDVIIDSLGVLTGIVIYLLLKKAFGNSSIRYNNGGK